MRKITLITISTVILLFIATMVLISTKGFKTDKFNNLISQKVNQLNPKIKLNLDDVKFKFKPSDFKFEVVTLDPTISIKNKKIDLEVIKFNLKFLDYINKKNPLSEISIISKENDIKEFTDFIDEYDFNLARSLIFKQIGKGKLKVATDITFDEKNPDKINYLINGSVNNAEINLLKQKINDLKFDFVVNQNVVNFKEIQLSFDRIPVKSDNLTLKIANSYYEISGDLKTKKSKINLNDYSKLINSDLDFLNNKSVIVSSDNFLSFKINNKFQISDLTIKSKVSFNEIFTKSKYQDLIYLKDGDLFVNYNLKELNIDLESNFLFKKSEYNNDKSKNIINIQYSKKQNENGFVNINLSNTTSKISSKEFKKLIPLKNFSLPDQDINFASENKINFNLDKNKKIKNLKIKSKIETENVIINYKSQRIKRYFSNFKNNIKLSKSEFNLEYDNNKFELDLISKYSIKDKNEDLSFNINKSDDDYFFNLNIDLDNIEIQIDELNYLKKSKIFSSLTVDGLYKKNKEIFFKKIEFKEDEKNILIENLEIGKNDKIKDLDLFKINIININQKKNELEFKKVNNNYYLTGSEFDGSENIKNLLSNSSKSVFSNFKNLNSFIYIDIGKYFIDETSYLSNTRGELKIKNNKIIESNINAKLNKNKKFELRIVTDKENQKITNILIDNPEPFIKNFKFIKGFKEGQLIYESSEFERKSISNLKINDFKVQEVPLLAKLLTLASLQGIADILTGEGIRFTDFEMDYETLGNTTKIKEMYAIGPAISLMMEGYIVKNDLTSLRGTLVPATTVNKTISKIPMLGEILVGKKIGEGVFGVSFKIKGPPKKLKTTVNPIKTLTPRFITRTLEKISN